MPNPPLQPLITIQVKNEGYTVGAGRYFFWGNLSQQVFSLFWDPFMLTRTGAVPAVREVDEVLQAADKTLLVYPHVTPASEADVIRAVLDANGRVVLNRPEAPLFTEIAALRSLGTPPAMLTSLRERWCLGARASRSFFYADRESFYRVQPSPAFRPLSWIGDNPDLLCGDRLALFCGDAFMMLDHYANVPFFTDLLLDVADLLIELVGCLCGQPVSAADTRRMQTTRELRRDFHALGFACLMVQELDRCHGHSRVELSEVAQRALEAARLLEADQPETAQRQLAQAFEKLAAENRKNQPTPAVFTDTLHGGGLFGDVGYFEFDWPQHAADVVRRHLTWARTIGYRFNIDFAAASIEGMAERFPRLMDDLRCAAEEGLVEFVNGTFDQPYPPFHTLESQIRHFDEGLATFQKVLGHRPRTYASQEFAFSPQIPALLAGLGYDRAVLRVQHFGEVPTMSQAMIDWQAPNGRSIATLPSHPEKSEQRNDLTYPNLHLKIFDQQQRRDAPAVFSGFGDVTFYRPFREELARISRYAPVFGAFATWSQCLSGNNGALPGRQFHMEDFQAHRVAMLKPDYGSISVAGNFTGHGIRSTAASNLFVAAELLEAARTIMRRGKVRDGGARYWRDLATYQGHDTYIVPYYTAGGFMGGVTDPNSRRQGRACPTVAEYLGPWDHRPIETTSGAALQVSEKAARRSIAVALRSLSARRTTTRWAVYNAAPARTLLVSLKGAAGRKLHAEGRPPATQDDGRDALARLRLPAWGMLMVDEAEDNGGEVAPFDAVRTEHASLENGLLRADFDPATGMLTRLIRKRDGASLLAEASHRFEVPGGHTQSCRQWRCVQAGPLRGCLEFEVVVPAQRGVAARVRSRVSLDAGDSLLHFEERVLACAPLKGDQWEQHLGVAFDVGHECPWQRSHFNLLEPSNDRYVFSPNLILADRASGPVTFINAGNQFYIRDGAKLRHVLVYEGEPTRSFRYAVGEAMAQPIMQARAWVQPCFAERIAAGKQRGNAPPAATAPAVSFIHTTHPAVELLSCRWVGERLMVRLANTSESPLETSLRSAFTIRAAGQTDLLGANLQPLTITDGGVTIPLAACDIVQVALEVDRNERKANP